MEGVEAFLDGEWESLCKLFSSDLNDGVDFWGAGVDATTFLIPSQESSITGVAHNVTMQSHESLMMPDYLVDDIMLPADSCNEMQANRKTPGKRPPVSRDAQQRKKKKGCNEASSSSSTCSSDSENNGKAPKPAKGPATDAQSLYARKRRERINERLKMLQNLVPNGTKVDISTMLEEAVHYVKFLQLQIKLLSSDEMWMYAPIAYNGMDMGLYNNIN